MSKLCVINNLLDRLAAVRDRWPDSKEELLPIIKDAVSSNVVSGDAFDWMDLWPHHKGLIYDQAFELLHDILSKERKFLQVLGRTFISK